MGRFLDRLRDGSSAHTVEMTGEGFAIIRREGEVQPFDRLAREVIDAAGLEYVAFPRQDQTNTTSYDRVYLIPLD